MARNREDGILKVQEWKDARATKRKGNIEPDVQNVLGIDLEIPVDIVDPKLLYKFVEDGLDSQGHNTKELFRKYVIKRKSDSFNNMKIELGQLVNFTN
jgi:hypothetical protein